jgi:phosphatidate cytidylyltransferase
MTTGGAPGPAEGPRSDLRLRVLSAIVMMAVALGALWAGGVVFAALAAVAAAAILVEWTAMSGPYTLRAAPKAAVLLVAVSVFAATWEPLTSAGLLLAVAAAIALGSVADPKMRWLAMGVVYGGIPGVAAVALRGGAPAGEPSIGLTAIAFVFLLVWATDSAAYFAGRAIGGPKLWPRVSPKKTWSGAIGGLAAAVLVGLGIAAYAGLGRLVPIAVIAALLSIVSQAGDLAESSMKRHFGVKDSGTMIPGHGGIMDRVDGLVVALVLAAAIGMARTGGTDAADGLLVW